MKVLVTGAGGFVGRWTCRALIEAGHDVLGAVRSMERVPPASLAGLEAVHWVPLELGSRPSVDDVLSTRPDGIIHCAAISSGAQARRDPVSAWLTNCLGTCELVYGLERLELRARFVLASTGEVYGRGHSRPIPEDAPLAPTAPYAASKVGAEAACLEAHRRWDLPVVLARCFAQTGPGQRADFVVPALALRLLQARAGAAAQISVGNLEPVREFVDVRDAASALVCLLERGAPGESYNIAAGRGQTLNEVFRRLCTIVGVELIPHADPALFRRADIDYLVGDGRRLMQLGWAPAHDLDTTLRDLVASIEYDVSASGRESPR